MTLTDYNGFTGKEREKYSKIQEKAIEKGNLKPKEETKCVICGQDKGIRVYIVKTIFQNESLKTQFQCVLVAIANFTILDSIIH